INGKRVNNKIVAASMISPGSASLLAGIGLLITNSIEKWDCYSECTVFNNFDDNFCWNVVSAYYREWGWGLFGTGLGLVAIGTGILFADDIGGNKDNNKIVMSSLVSLGGVAAITGVGLLIASAVIARKHPALMIMQLQPELYFSPQLSGFGISGRF
ncbi:MAG: hypothetical protein J6A01_05415, partial [Proteobacteria bacterium]|nr:hypothetical protein [Pseudomonadota bacterium]